MEQGLARALGARARVARKRLGFTQEDAAERIGISAPFYARIERGTTMPSVPTLAKIADVLEESADVLLGRADDDQPDGKLLVMNEPVVAYQVVRRGQPQLTDLASSAPAVSRAHARSLRLLERRLRSASAKTIRILSMLAAELNAAGRVTVGRERTPAKARRARTKAAQTGHR